MTLVGNRGGYLRGGKSHHTSSRIQPHIARVVCSDTRHADHGVYAGEVERVQTVIHHDFNT